jgi:hypothetical protein
MINLSKVEDISMKWLLKDGSECYDCIQDEGSLILSDDKSTIKVTLKPSVANSELDTFDLIITKKENKYWIKTDFYNSTKLYALRSFESENEYIFVLEDPIEITYIHANCIE